MAEEVELPQTSDRPMTPPEMAMRIAGLEMELAGRKKEYDNLLQDYRHQQDLLKVAKARTELQLNLKNPFEKVINEMVQLQRVKSQDYADEDDILKNMRFVTDMLGIAEYTVVEDCNAMVLRKCARIINLRGKSASNESVRDSYVDRAVYAVLAIVALNGEEKSYLVPEEDDYDYDEEDDG